MIKRYSLKNLVFLFSDKNKYNNWLRIENLLLEYLSTNKGWLEKNQKDNLIADMIALPSEIAEEERKIKHDVAAFVNCISASATSKSRKWIHFGLTSSDLVDTGNSMILKEVNDEIMRETQMLLRRLEHLSIKHKNTYQINRYQKNGQSPILSFGYTLAIRYSQIKESLERLSRSRKRIECASISGSVGNNLQIGPDFQDFVARKLDLYSASSSKQVISRERYYSYFSILNSISQSINELAMELRFLCRKEIAEASESFHRQQLGSSSMPHKKNPISLENICGLSRLMDGYVSALSKNIPIWLERDISHSSVDRVVFLDASTTIIQMIKRMTKVLQEITINKELMMKRSQSAKELLIKKRIKKFLVAKKKLLQPELNSYMEKIHEYSIEKNISILDVFKASNLCQELTEEELNDLCNYDLEFKYLDELYKRIFLNDGNRYQYENIYYNKNEIEKTIDSIAANLNNYYKKSSDEIIHIINFGYDKSVFLSKILPKLNFKLEIKSIRNVEVKKEEKSKEDFSFIRKQKVLILDEVVNTGTTLSNIKRRLEKFKPKEIKVCCLFSTGKSPQTSDFPTLKIPTSADIAGFGIGTFKNSQFVGKVRNKRD